jgi:sarcosine dehydrogenase
LTTEKDLPNVRDHDLSVYLKTQGDAMAIGGYEQNPEFWHDVDPNFHFGLFDLDWDTFGQNLEGHMTRCPAIAEAGIKSTVCGPESFTPDHKPLVGPQPGVRGFFNACGFNSMGMMLGGGIGREVATWINQGAPDVDIFSFDCARYHPDTVRDSKWVFDRTHESYAKTYSIVFPHDEALAGRGFRKSALHAELERRGCVRQARHGYERPGWFDPAAGAEAGAAASESAASESAASESAGGDAAGVEVAAQSPKPYDFYGAYASGAWRLAPDHPDVPAHSAHRYNDLIEGELTFGWPASHTLVADECRAAREGAALFDQSYFGKFFLQGPRADAAVQWLCGADMRGKAVGSVTYTPMCNAQGGVEADLTVTRLEDRGEDENDSYSGGSSSSSSSCYYFAAGGNTMTKDFEWISARLEEKGFTSADVTLRDASSEFSILSVQGPHVRALLQPLMGTGGVDLGDDDAFPFSTCLENSVTIAGHPVALCLRLTFVGELGYELHVANEHAAAVYREIRRAGEAYERAHGVPVRDAGYRAIDSLSAEKNYRHWHADLSNRDTPMEAGIGFTVLGKLKQEVSPKEEEEEEEGREGEGRSSGSGGGDIGVDFLGRQALEAHRARGLQRKLVCLVLDDATRPLHGLETIWRDEHIVGYVRSTAFGHTLGKTIAYGYVDKPIEGKLTNKWLKAGNWEIGDCGERLAAELHVKAPFDPTNLRVKGEYV